MSGWRKEEREGHVPGESPSSSAVRGIFEAQFLGTALEKQIALCEENPLAEIFRKTLSGHDPVLEAGCGSGRWVAWFARQGWSVVGLDWSVDLCERACQAIPDARFVTGDLRDIPFEDDHFGSVLALGSIEHIVEGPLPILNEIGRVLQPGGVAIITVPHGGGVRRVVRALKRPVARLKMMARESASRRRGEWVGPSYRLACAGAVAKWAPEFRQRDGGYHFYEYDFTARQMRSFLRSAGLSIVEERVFDHDAGILNTFGRVAGVYWQDEGRIELSHLGRVLRWLLPVKWAGHMLLYIVK